MNSKIRFSLLIYFFVLLPGLVFSQQMAEISLGAGLPDLINMKFKLGNKVQVYGGAGFLPGQTLSSFTTGIDIHFPIKSEENKTRKFFLNNGIAFLPAASSYSGSGDKLVIWYSRIGFSIYNSHKKDKSGFDFDFGLMVETGSSQGVTYGPHVITGTRQVIEYKRFIGPAASLSYFFVL